MTPTDTAERVKEDVERLRRKTGQAIEDGMDAAARSLRKTRAELMDARDEARRPGLDRFDGAGFRQRHLQVRLDMAAERELQPFLGAHGHRRVPARGPAL